MPTDTHISSETDTQFIRYTNLPFKAIEQLFIMTRSTLFKLGLAYLSAPCIIFLLGWYDWFIGIPAVSIIAYMMYALTKDVKGEVHFGSMRFEIFLCILIIAWVIVSGVGGYMWQNRWDHLYRNAAFCELVNNNWPVIKGGEELCYYFGYWLPAALFAKCVHSLEAGYIFQVVWGCFGIWLAIRLLFDRLKDVNWRYIAVFILFGGLDILGVILVWDFPLQKNLHIELWNGLAFFESNTTMLCWVYNQVIPAWVGCLLIFGNELKMSKIAPFVLAVMMISCPFPVVGLLPLVLFYEIRECVMCKNIRSGMGKLFSFGNIAALLVGVLSFLFMSRNGALELTKLGNVGELLYNLALLFLLEIFFLYPFVKKWVNKCDFIILCATLLVLAVVPTQSADMVSRAFIPLGVFLIIGCCQFVKNMSSQSHWKRMTFYVLSVIVSLTACIELSRGIYMTIQEPRDTYRNEQLKSIFDDTPCRRNFIAPAARN